MRYIAFVEERAKGGSLCNLDHLIVIESDEEPTIATFQADGRVTEGPCSYIGAQSCEECTGFYIGRFQTEEFSWERAIELGLARKAEGSVNDIRRRQSGTLPYKRKV